METGCGIIGINRDDIKKGGCMFSLQFKILEDNGQENCILTIPDESDCSIIPDNRDFVIINGRKYCVYNIVIDYDNDIMHIYLEH